MCKGTMINFSVSRPGSISKPMRACDNKKKALKINMNTLIHTCSPISHSHKMASFSVNFYSLNGKSGLLGEWFEKEEEERERERERERGREGERSL